MLIRGKLIRPEILRALLRTSKEYTVYARRLMGQHQVWKTRGLGKKGGVEGGATVKYGSGELTIRETDVMLIEKITWVQDISGLTSLEKVTKHLDLISAARKKKRSGGPTRAAKTAAAKLKKIEFQRKIDLFAEAMRFEIKLCYPDGRIKNQVRLLRNILDELTREVAPSGKEMKEWVRILKALIERVSGEFYLDQLEKRKQFRNLVGTPTS